MSAETFFTLSEYKQNYERLGDEFVNAYEDNDQEEFISLQIEWYQKCLANTELEWTVSFDGDIGWFPKVFFNDSVIMWQVIEKIRNENGGMDPTSAQNLNVSFGKIVKFLKEKLDTAKRKIGTRLSAAQAMLYHVILQQAKLEPEFPMGGKEKALEALSLRYGPSMNNLKKKFNIIGNGAKRGYSEEDAKIVRELIKKHHPSILPIFQDRTKHILL